MNTTNACARIKENTGLCPESLIISVYNTTLGLPKSVVEIEIPFDRAHESWNTVAFVMAYQTGRIPKEDDKCGNQAPRLIHHRNAIKQIVRAAGQDRVLPLLKMTDFNTYFTLDIKWFTGAYHGA
tara:strand:- start:389 stop:763 length:375 start_codon:yes stop_codon:yes gene_type:complete